MTKETRIGLLVGLVFIIMFGLVLAELTKAKPDHQTIVVEDPSRSAPAPDLIAPAIPPAPAAAASGAVTPTGTDSRTTIAAAGGGTELVESRTVVPAGTGGSSDFVLRDPTEIRSPGGTVTPTGTSVAVAPPSGTTLVAAPVGQPYVIQQGDTLIKIARKVYGQDKQGEYKRIFAANRDVLKDETNLVPGKTIVIPPLASVAPAAGGPRVGLDGLDRRFPAAPPATPAAAVAPLPPATPVAVAPPVTPAAPVVTPTAPGKEYVVKAGDTLSKIARKLFNDDSNATLQKIYNANKDRITSRDALKVGLKLEIPS